MKEHIKVLVENGFVVEKEHKHIYNSKSKRKFIVLSFNGHSDVIDEEEFEDLDSCINKFLKVTGGQK